MAKRKVYYKVEVRIYETHIGREELRIFNDGYIIFEDDEFQGYLALDYIMGIFDKDESMLLIEIEDFENYEEEFTFSNEADEIELPGKYILYSEVPNDNKNSCVLEFISIEKNPLKQKEIEKTLQEIKYIHRIPD